MDLGLKDRVALVAASSQGIGRADCGSIRRGGLPCANLQTLQAAAEKMRKQHSAEVLVQAFDVTNAAAVQDFVAAVVKTFGSVDICVTNAGRLARQGFPQPPLSKNGNARSMNLLFQHGLLRARSHPLHATQTLGARPSPTSITTKQPVADLVLSNAVRAAVVGLVKSLANEFGKDGILVNNVGPGFTATDRLKQLAKRAPPLREKQKKKSRRMGRGRAPARLGEPREVADTIVWLASERASYITGQTILVDGGIYKGL